MKTSFLSHYLSFIFFSFSTLSILLLIRINLNSIAYFQDTTLNCELIFSSKFIELFTSTSLLLLTTIIVTKVIVTDKLLLLVYSFVFAGGLSNIIERQIFNCVTDYISFTKYLSVNIPDILISFGVLTIILKLSIKPVLLSKAEAYVNR